MRYELFSDQSTTSDTGLIIPNHWASPIEGTSGDRAEYSMTLGMPVLTYERPESVTLEDLPRFTKKSYLKDVNSRAELLQQILKENDLGECVIASNSSGALETLAIAATGKLAVKHVIAMEPVGMWNIKFSSPWHAISYFASQMREDKTEVDLEEYRNLTPLNPIRPTPPNQSGRMKNEMLKYYYVYTSDLGIRLLRKLAAEQPNVPVDLVLGDNSKTMSVRKRRSVVEEFEGSSVKVELLPGGHSFPDPNEHFVHTIRRVMQRITSQPSEV